MRFISCTKLLTILFAFTILTFTTNARIYRGYQYYNTREDYPVKRTSTQTYSKSQIDNAWIKVPWTHGGHYYHNKLTREDRDDTPSCLNR